MTPVFSSSRCPNFSKTADTLCHRDILEICHEVCNDASNAGYTESFLITFRKV